jgi:uncharacterized protein YdaU (DUF1376 family)
MGADAPGNSHTGAVHRWGLVLSDKANIWMPLYIGDYLRDTTRLTTTQHGAYLLLIMDYWTSGPPPDDDTVLASITKLSTDEWDKVRPSLVGKFDVVDGVWHHGRIDREIETSRKNKEAYKARSAKGIEARYGNKESLKQSLKQSLKEDDKQSLKQSLKDAPSPSPSPSPSYTTSTSSSEEDNTQRSPSKNNRKSAAALAVISRPDDVSEATWEGWQALRKAKRAPITAGVISTLRAESMKAGMVLEAALQTCCLRGWAGFKADWMQERRQSATERAAEAVARLTGQRDHERGITYIEHDDEISF